MKNASHQPLISTQQQLGKSTKKSALYSSADLSPIQRYNVFIECYNNPINKVSDVELKYANTSSVYDSLFRTLRTSRGKLLTLFLILVPGLNVLVLSLAIYCFCLYWSALKVHQDNMTMGVDPFKHMIFDPQLCYTLKRDFYFFNIQFKDLQGFTLNYNQQMKKQLHLRRERGKASFMVYNATFWAHFHHFTRWKNTHIIMVIAVILIVLAANIGFVLLLILIINQ